VREDVLVARTSSGPGWREDHRQFAFWKIGVGHTHPVPPAVQSPQRPAPLHCRGHG